MLSALGSESSILGLPRCCIGIILGLYRDSGKRKWKLLYINGGYILPLEPESDATRNY